MYHITREKKEGGNVLPTDNIFMIFSFHVLSEIETSSKHRKENEMKIEERRSEEF